jgi:glycosyltransferase involved in cell wall biosynthesis
MNFSIILNSRGRPHYLMSLLDSIFSKAKTPDLIEVLIKLDDDDHETINTIGLLEMINPNLKIIISPRPANLHVTINELAAISTGDFLFVINDDVIFNTEDWDSIILEKASAKFKEN